MSTTCHFLLILFVHIDLRTLFCLQTGLTMFLTMGEGISWLSQTLTRHSRLRNSWYADKNQTKGEDKPLLCVCLQNHAPYTSTGFRKNLCNWSSGSCILSWTRESLLLAWSSTNINSPNPVDTNKRTSRIQDMPGILMHVRLMPHDGCLCETKRLLWSILVWIEASVSIQINLTSPAQHFSHSSCFRSMGSETTL